MFVVQIVQALFPRPTRRPALVAARTGGRLSGLFAIACALVPLAAMGHAMATTV